MRCNNNTTDSEALSFKCVSSNALLTTHIDGNLENWTVIIHICKVLRTLASFGRYNVVVFVVGCCVAENG